MASTIYLTGEFNNKLLTSFEISLKRIPVSERRINLLFHTLGGYLDIVDDVSGLMFERKDTMFIGQMMQAESSALKLYVNCDQRHVTAGSRGVIRLPVPSSKTIGSVSRIDLEKQNQVRNTSIALIHRRTGMTYQQIEDLEGMPLGPDEMLRYRIATHKVQSFLLQVA
jgi:hypothetical protein